MKYKLLPILLFTTITLSANDADTLLTHNMDELVVVSTPKEHIALNKQPLSSTTLGNSQIKQKNINNIKDLTAHIPGLFIPRYGSRLTSSIYLRGVGSRIGTPAVGMYVDDIPLANMSSMDQDLSDADRIDVLRGPQGTLFGRNTIGGLIRIYTKNPMNYQGTDLMLGAATYNNYRARVTHYHRPIENFAFSAGVSYEHQGGFFRNHALGGHHADRGDDLSARWRGIFLPSDRVRLDLSARYQWTKQGGYPYAAKEGSDAGKVAYNREGSYLRHLLTVGLNAEHQFNRAVMTSTTGFQFLKDDMFMDQDFSRQDLYSLQQKQKSKVLSEEIAIKSKDNERWQWTNGVNFQYQWLDSEAPVTFYQEGVDWLSQVINGYIPKNMPMSLTLKNSTMPMGGTFQTPTLTLGAFHQSTIKIAKNLSFSLGIRFDYEHYKMVYDAPGCAMNYDFSMSMYGKEIRYPGLQADAPILVGKTSDHDLHILPKASLKYDFCKSGNIYASIGRGYRSGGYNVQLFSDLLQTEMKHQLISSIPRIPNGLSERIFGPKPSIEQTTYYKPETAWNYEIGTHLNFFDGRLKADLAAFWIETRDLQISQMAESGLGRVTVNADKSRSIGMEASLQASVTDALSVNATYGYTHATLRHSGNEAHPTDYFVPFAPQHTMALGAQYTWHTRGWMQDITLGATGKGNGRIYWTRENDLSQPFYALLDARLSVRHDNLELALWGSNLTATHYDAFCFATRGQAFSQLGTPLQVGIECRMKF
ncbi:MAG: TonB-dependent receptor [Bacteroidaceae bacterium]|nr:TonB-dependent receptor [Bacteroidaceae bacterium]